MRHLFTLFALTALLTGPALAYQVDHAGEPAGITDVILEQAFDAVAPALFVVQELGSTGEAIASTDVTAPSSRVDACASRTVTYAELVECQRMKPPAWQPLRHDAYAYASLDTTKRDTRSQTWPIPSPRQSTPSLLATPQ